MLERLAGPQIRLITAIAPDVWPIEVDSLSGEAVGRIICTIAALARFVGAPPRETETVP